MTNAFNWRADKRDTPKEFKVRNEITTRLEPFVHGLGKAILRETVATIEKLQAEVERLKAELSWTEVLLEECKMDWSGDVTQIKAEHAHETSSLKSEAELKVEQLNSRIEERTALCIKRVAEVTRERNLLQTEVERLSAYNKLAAAPQPKEKQ